MSLTVLHNAEELTAHLSAWEDLAAHTIEPNVFYEPWMLLPALDAFGRGENLCFVLIYTNGPSNEGSKPLLCGFFPLRISRRFRGLPVRYAGLWRHKYCVLCTPLLRPEYASDCLATFFDWLSETPETGALLELRQISGEGQFNQLLTHYLNESHNLYAVEERLNRALLEPCAAGSAAAEAYLTTALSGKRRKELRRQEKLLREHGQLEYVELTPGTDEGIWAEQFLQLEAQGWKGQEGSALASNAASREFFLQITRAAAARGQLMMIALRLNGTPIAMKCNLLSPPGSFAFKIAFDERFASYSPGVHLELENICRVHEHPELEWMDSCATAKHFMINRLWLTRRSIKTLLIATGKNGGNFIVALAPLSRWFKRKFYDKVTLPN